MLAASGWWGKQFVDAETVHPLLFPTADGAALWALNPVLAFGGLGVATRIPAAQEPNFAGAIARSSRCSAPRAPKARLRTTRYRGVDTATMIYDQLPINDVFRGSTSAGSETVLGAMDLRGSARPYFFVLRRDDSLRACAAQPPITYGSTRAVSSPISGLSASAFGSSDCDLVMIDSTARRPSGP